MLASIFLLSLLFFLKKLVLINRYCEKCRGITPHVVDFGYGKRFSYLLTFVTLGWRTMIMQYYPLKCRICGHTFKTLKEDTEYTSDKPRGWHDASEWHAFGGHKNWNQLRLSQRIFMGIMISAGVFIAIMYLFGGVIMELLKRLAN